MNDVRRQYEKWIYPVPIDDLEADRRAGTFDLSDPALFRRKLWPRPIEPANLKILVAGCGTMQAARIAFRNREHRRGCGPLANVPRARVLFKGEA